ncbi:MAG TPA: hypothetical protein V6C50_11505 [Crinalium sp.]
MLPAGSHQPPQRGEPTRTPLVEATGWQVSPTGAISLVASTPDPTVPQRLVQPLPCQGRSSAAASHTP